MNHKTEQEKKKLQKLIEEEFGKNSIHEPNTDWTPEKEKKFLDDYENKIKTSVKKEQIIETEEKVIINRLFTKNKRECSICKKNVLSNRDTVYITKHHTCEKCYFMSYEGKKNADQC